MRRNPYRIGKSGGISPRLRQKLERLPSLKGYEGRWYRRALIAVGLVIVAVLLVHFLKPETTLMSSVEIKRVESKGILSVGVRWDMPGFCEEGSGLEAELAMLLAQRILPDSEDPLRLVECTSTTVSTKLKDGSIDVAIALQPKGSSSAYSYSYPYYTDKVYLLTLDPENVSKQPWELAVGYIPGTPSGSAFASYVSGKTAVRERSLFDRLLGRPAPTQDPNNALSFESVKYGSYDELISSLKRGDIDAAVIAGAYVRKYFEGGETDYYLCSTVISTLEYCIIASSDDPALTQIANMLIYSMQEDGSLDALTAKYSGAR